jgi:hypothetical protein
VGGWGGGATGDGRVQGTTHLEQRVQAGGLADGGLPLLGTLLLRPGPGGGGGGWGGGVGREKKQERRA